MIISTNPELRLHLPSNAVDDVLLLQGILDNSEKDFLKDKLGATLYDKLCEYYQGISKETFVSNVNDGTYASDPWAELLLNAQRMVANDAMARFIYQQAVSVNSSGVNMASSEDYASADTKALDKSASAFRREAMVALNNMLILLEGWAEELSAAESSASDGSTAETSESTEADTAKAEIVALWQKSKYYYLHSDLLISTCAALQHYIDIYDSRDKFIRFLPDLHFIQDEYVADLIGDDVLDELKASDDAADKRIVKKIKRLMVALLEERTTVLTIDKQRRQTAHDEATSLRQSVLVLLQEREAKKKAEAEQKADADTPQPAQEPDEGKGYENNQTGSRMFVSPVIY
jgi:hypothetical protein